MSLAASGAQAQQATTLPEVDVSAQSQTSEPGVLLPQQTANVGPLAAQKPLDSPYQTNVISQEIIQSQNMRSIADMVKIDPSVQMSRGIDGGRWMSRGFESGVVQNTRQDGMNIISTTGFPIEEFDHLEILHGSAGALYGPQNATGMFNFITKRPTDVPTQTIGYGFDSGAVSNVYGDVGAQVENVGMRLNFVHADGESWAPTSDYRRNYVGAAFDIKLAPSTKIELNGSYYNWHYFGFPGSFVYGGTGTTSSYLPSPVNAARAGYGVPGTGNQNDTYTFSGRLLHDFGNGWSLTLGALNQTVDRGLYQPINTLTNNLGNYTTSINQSKAGKFAIVSDMGTLNGHFDTGFIGHDVFIGFTGFSWDTYNGTGINVNIGSASLSNPAVFATPYYSTSTQLYVSSNVFTQALVMGDTLKFNEQWALSLNQSFSWLDITNKSSAGVTTSEYNANGAWSPSASLLYHPFKNQTIYFSYSNSLVQGDTAPATAVNANQTLAPYRSTQYELGYKYQINDRLLFTAAGFRLNQPFSETTSANVFQATAQQVNWGSEVMLTGRLTDDLSVTGGFQQLIPKLTNTGVAATEDKDVVNMPRFQANLLVEYRIPMFEGLSVNGNIHYAAKRAANDANTTFAGDYATLDLGARYITAFQGHKVQVRVNVFNVTDTKYWQTIYPTSGTSLGGSQAYLGAPRTVSASLDVSF